MIIGCVLTHSASLLKVTSNILQTAIAQERAAQINEAEWNAPSTLMHSVPQINQLQLKIGVFVVPVCSP